MTLTDVALSSAIKCKLHAHILDCNSWSYVAAITVLFIASILTS
jgi:hypothetical protein